MRWGFVCGVLATVEVLGGSAVVACGGSSHGSDGGGNVGDTGVDEFDAYRPIEAGLEGSTEGSCAPQAEPYDSGTYPLPTATSIQFTAKNPLPSGEQILYNDWGVEPNTVNSLSPSGVKTEVFDVYRAWSLGVSHDGKSIAFSCGDPNQQQDFGLSIGDSIQQTWIYDAPSQAIRLVAHGNINDECHTFGPADTSLWVCRRYDFAETGSSGNVTGTNKGYRIGAIDVASTSFTWMTADDSASGVDALYPQPTADGAGFYYSTTAQLTATTTQSTVMHQATCGGAPATVHASARDPVLSPDGTRYVYSDETNAGALRVSNVDGSGDALITTDPGTNPTWSPDGTRIAYLLYDNTANCSHIEVIPVGGGQATRVRDCGGSQEFITQIAWFTAP